MTPAQRTCLFAAYVAVVTLSGWTPLTSLYRHSTIDNTASHVVLIPFISLGLVVMRRDVIFRSVSTSRGVGVGIVGMGASLLGWTLATGPNQPSGLALTIAIVPIVLTWIGGFVLLYGTRAARAAQFPLLFLLFTAPFPPALLQLANNFLKDGSTEAVAVLLTLTGTPQIREGYVFTLPFLAIEVADACSGIRSSIGLFITSLLAGHLFLRTAWRRIVLALVIVPITIFKNAVRIVTLVLLSIHVDRSYLSGQLHHDGGIVFFLISLGLLTPILLLLSRSERAARQPSQLRAGLVPGVTSVTAR